MTLQEVLSTGKAIKRSMWDNSEAISVQQLNEGVAFTASELLAGDWEVVDTTFIFTESQFRTMWDEARSGLLSVKDLDNSPLGKKLLSLMKQRT